MKPSTIIRKFTHTPPVQWRELASELISTEVDDAVKVIDSQVENLMMIRGYITRYVDARDVRIGHRDGVKESGRLVTGVRKLLGYTYPKKGVVNF